MKDSDYMPLRKLPYVLLQEAVDAYAESVAKEIPAGRAGTSEELGDAVVFLASDLSKYITGIELTVDGGMTQVYAGNNGTM